MELNILNRSYTLLKVVDQFESLIWTVRYNEAGDFEIKAIVNNNNLGFDELMCYLVKGNRVTIRESDRMMIIESVNYVSDFESGDNITVKGRSLESVLDRRVVKNKITIDGSLQDGILRLLNENIIDPEDENRRIDGFSMKMSEDEEITSIEVTIDFYGDNLLDTIESLCKTYNIGFRVLPNFENAGYVFELYRGTDRSYDQDIVAPVVFSPRYENLINSNYTDSDESMKNVAFVENENDNLKIEVYQGLKFDFELDGDESKADPPKGVERREIFISSSVSRPEVTPYGPPESEVNREEHGYWEKTIDYDAYNNWIAKATQDALDQIEKAGGTEADIGWPPLGWEGTSYVSYCCNFATPEDFAEWKFIPDTSYQPAVLSKEEQQKKKFEAAMADPTKYALYQMREEGFESLLENRTVKAFDGEIVNYFQFVAQRDYFLGDVVQMVNNMFVNVKTRFTELTFTEDSSGVRVVPSFLTDIEIDAKEEL